MKQTTSLLLIVAFVSSFVMGQDRTASFDANTMRQRVKRLSADDLEGRGPGTAGGKLAAQYIADQLKAGGIRPANKGSYFQNVDLVGVKADPKSVLRSTGVDDGGTTLNFGDDFVATTGAQAADVSVSANIVFVGYGINAPEYNWNDYKGDPKRFQGKWLMILVNDPPATKQEPALFAGKALTYYGRWTYKYEEAARRGAAGVILIHTTPTAGYGWNVVRTSNGNWRYEIARKPVEATPFLRVKAWATESGARKLFAHATQNFDAAVERAKRRDFEPEEFKTTVSLDLHSDVKKLSSPNVVGMTEGTDKRLKSEYVVMSAHWDHLGIGEPNAAGDRIYNGAYDNASGVATILAIADVIAKMPKVDRPKRSFLFLFPTAEEQGLLGAEYYSKNPLVPLNKTVADFNIDGVNFFGKVSDFAALGAERSSIMEPILAAALERKLVIKGDSQPEQGFFYRSDHFPFAKVGVPSVNFQHGDQFITPPSPEAASFFKDYTTKYYHQVTDEYRDWWSMDAMVQEAELALAVGLKLANSPEVPRYKDTDQFSAADKARFLR
jgi:Zn-dependent M28 family amino/carboxypeptidase